MAVRGKQKNNAVQPQQSVSSPLSSEVKPLFQGVVEQGFAPLPASRVSMLIQGFSKSGKTTFAISNPDAVVLDFENGTRFVPIQRGRRMAILPTEEELETGIPGPLGSLDPIDRFHAAVDLLMKDAQAGNPQFQTVAIDTVDTLFGLAIARFCQDRNIENIGDYKDGRAGWFEMRDPILQRFIDLRRYYGLHLLTHLQEKVLTRADGTSTVMIEATLAPSVRRALLNMVEQIVMISRTTVFQSREKVPVVLSNGKKVMREDPRGPEERHVVVLRTAPISSARELGCRITVPGTIELPWEDPWGEYVKHYDEEVARIQATL